MRNQVARTVIINSVLAHVGAKKLRSMGNDRYSTKGKIIACAALASIGAMTIHSASNLYKLHRDNKLADQYEDRQRERRLKNKQNRR